MNSIPGVRIPKADFMDKSVSTNRTILRIGTAFGAAFELLSMLRVLAFTSARLSTLNNRIYFGLYLTYFLACIAFLIVDYRGSFSTEARYRLYEVSGVIMLSWHTIFNVYDIYRAGALGNFTVITAIFLFSGFLMFAPAYTLACLGICWAAFSAYLWHMFSSGEATNFSATVGLCALMYLIRLKHLSIEAMQAQQIREVRQKLSEAQMDFRLTIEQYELISERESSISFEWNVREDWARFSKEWKHYFDAPEAISGLRKYINGLEQISPANRDALNCCMDNIARGVPYQKYEFVLPTRGGEERWFELRVITQSDGQGQPVAGIGMLSDITDRKEKIANLEGKLQMDLFTGLLNKSAIERYGARRLSELRIGQKVAALILDMDDFKDINDRYGHPAGDYVLREVAAIMRDNAPAGARIGRIGGDEFMAIMSLDDLAEFERYAHELLKRVRQIRWQDMDVAASCSIGLSATATPGDMYHELYRRTDEALYQAKRQGKSRLYRDYSGLG